MPALRLDKVAFSYKGPLSSNTRNMSTLTNTVKAKPDLDAVQVQQDIYFPTTTTELSAYRTTKGKALTSHQWDVYDFIMKVPRGQVTTYKDICASVGGSPRSVGNALRNNPFAPYVPCHRVIASSLFIGGFKGEWGPEHKTGTHCGEKADLLAGEGVGFTPKGQLLNPEAVLWK